MGIKIVSKKVGQYDSSDDKTSSGWIEAREIT